MLWNTRFTDPWNDDLWSTVRGLRRAFDDLGDAMRGNVRAGEYPPINVWSRDDGCALSAEMPGIDPASIDISAAGDTVTLRGRRTVLPPVDNAQCLRAERADIDFTRTVQLPFPVDAGSAVAQYRQGVLSVSLSIASEQKPRRIAVANA